MMKKDGCRFEPKDRNLDLLVVVVVLFKPNYSIHQFTLANYVIQIRNSRKYILSCYGKHYSLPLHVYSSSLSWTVSRWLDSLASTESITDAYSNTLLMIEHTENNKQCQKCKLWLDNCVQAYRSHTLSHKWSYQGQIGDWLIISHLWPLLHVRCLVLLLLNKHFHQVLLQGAYWNVPLNFVNLCNLITLVSNWLWRNVTWIWVESTMDNCCGLPCLVVGCHCLNWYVWAYSRWKVGL